MSSIRNGLFGAPPAEGMPGHVSGFLGGVVADEPRAAVVGREVLSAGGTAADAAVAMGFALSVTLPSRAGLGGGGACLAYSPDPSSANRGEPEAIMFTPVAATRTGAATDRPAAVPMMARGLFALHARYGRRPFESLIIPAERMAGFGAQVSRAFIRDLALVAGPLFVDPAARAIFSHNGTPLAEGDRLTQAELGSTLAAIRAAGVGDLYQGSLAHRLIEAAPAVGAAFSIDDLRNALPHGAAPIRVAGGRDTIAFLPPPADGGLAAAVAFQALQGNPSQVEQANARGLAAAARWRAGGITDLATLLQADLPAANLPELPASTTFLALDRNGNAVACAVSMDNLFGTGRIVPGTGLLLAASPASVPPPLLTAAIGWNRPLHAFRAAVGGSGQASAPFAAALALTNTLRTGQPMAALPPEPGRANVIACSRYLPGAEGSCAWATDSRGSGLAVGSE
ncbi:MAG: gamma-glutamyltransferase [Alphaproteobacteria bacterium]|nr:gamma-glutamyltransferase [Alphaproteobacteria bacterium]